MNHTTPLPFLPHLKNILKGRAETRLRYGEEEKILKGGRVRRGVFSATEQS